MKNFFKPEDFSQGHPGDWTPYSFESMASVANAKLEKLIESWPVVYGKTNLENEVLYGTVKAGYDTHKARLAFIEPLVTAKCKHEPSPIESYNGRYVSIEKPFCKLCGIELIATWGAK